MPLGPMTGFEGNPGKAADDLIAAPPPLPVIGQEATASGIPTVSPLGGRLAPREKPPSQAVTTFKQQLPQIPAAPIVAPGFADQLVQLFQNKTVPPDVQQLQLQAKLEAFRRQQEEAARNAGFGSWQGGGGYGGTSGNGYEAGGYQGGIYGGSGGSSINQGVGGAFRNR